MNINLKEFESQLPIFFNDFLSTFEKHGFSFTFVGGLVRDFFLTQKVGYDWDIELRHETLAFNSDHWKSLGKELTKFGKTSFLSYDIIRLDVNGYQIELSPPRKEIFEDKLSHLGHSNFSVEFNFQMPFHEAIGRRDFTINAMGVQVKEKKFTFLDPLNGLVHLREKILHHAGADFSRDPVRFLRAVRFALIYKLEFSPELEALLYSMDTSKISASYLWSEMQKSGDQLSFYQNLLLWKDLHPELNLPVGKELLSHMDEVRTILLKPNLQESWIIALEWVNIPSDPWQAYFSLSTDSGTRPARWAQTTKSFLKILPEHFQGEFEAIRERVDFLQLFDWYFTTKQILQKNPQIPLIQLIEKFLPEWGHLFRFEAVKDVKHIDPPFRAKYQVWDLCQRT